MTHASHLFNLYPSILVSILNEWLYDVDLCSLDSAVCNCKLREIVLSVVSKCHIKNFVDLYTNDDRSEWICKRGMGIRSFDSSGHSCLSSTEKEIISRSSYLDFLVGSNLSVVLDVLALCPVVHYLELSGEISDSDFQLVVSQVKDVRVLNLAYCASVTELINCDIASYFPDLVEFHSTVDASLIVQTCKQLATLSCFGSPQSIESVVGSESIKSLTLYYYYEPTGTTELDLLKLAGLSSLVEFTIQEPIVTDEVVTRLSVKCPALTAVDFGESAISDVGLISIAKHCKNLKSLSIFSQLVTDQSVISVAKGCPLLTKLKISGCYAVSDEAVSTILHTCKNLEELYGHEGISKSVYNDVFSVCPSLRWLDLDTVNANIISNPVLPDLAMEEISFDGGNVKIFQKYRDCSTQYTVRSYAVLFVEESIVRSFQISPGLLKVNLEYQYHITDTCVSALVQSCTHLTCVEISECRGLTSASIITIMCGCSRLQRLAVCGMMSSPTDSTKLQMASKQLTSLSLKHSSVEWLLSEITDQCPSLRTVEVQFAGDLSGDTVVQLLHGCCSLNYLRIQEAMVGPEVLQCIVDLNRRMKLVELIRCPLLDNVDQELLRLAENSVGSLLIQYEI